MFFTCPIVIVRFEVIVFGIDQFALVRRRVGGLDLAITGVMFEVNGGESMLIVYFFDFELSFFCQ
jgi:hypothetical protein